MNIDLNYLNFKFFTIFVENAQIVGEQENNSKEVRI